jgi:branched-chain amino acid transport system ATP-binding protein
VARGLCVGVLVTAISLFFVPFQVHSWLFVGLTLLLTAVLFSLASAGLAADDPSTAEAEERASERRAGMSQPLLSVNGLMMRFGGLLAVNNVNLDLHKKEIVSLIGPNGAGKTTVFNCLTGFYKPTGGTIMLRDQHLEGLPGQQIARMGVVRTFQHVRLFREMTVIENLLVAQHQQLKTGLFSGLLKTPAFRRAQDEALDRAATWLDRIGLLQHANRQASNLAYGDQRRLEIVRCMVTQPEILMLDEPAAGLNPKETKELDSFLKLIKHFPPAGLGLLIQRGTINHTIRRIRGIHPLFIRAEGKPVMAMDIALNHLWRKVVINTHQHCPVVIPRPPEGSCIESTEMISPPVVEARKLRVGRVIADFALQGAVFIRQPDSIAHGDNKAAPLAQRKTANLFVKSQHRMLTLCRMVAMNFAFQNIGPVERLFLFAPGWTFR